MKKILGRITSILMAAVLLTGLAPAMKAEAATLKKVTSGGLQAKVTWDIIYGSNGYNVFVTTNPKGTWVWNQSTATKASARTATIKSYRGAALKKYTNYYFRIVTRRKRNGVFCTVPMPAADYYTGSFRFN